MTQEQLNIIIQAKDMASAVMSKLGNNVEEVGKSFKKIGDNVKNFGKEWSTFVSVPILGLGGVMFKAASDAEETRNRFNAVFRGLESQANSFADTLADSVGRSRYTIRDGLAAFQGFSLGLGMSKDAAFDFSTQLQQMAIDFASFNNISDTEAQERFIAAMSGSAEVLDQFGVNIREAQIELKLAELGINKTSQQASEMEKAMARLQIIKDVMGSQGALGDAAKTAGSAANQTRAAQAQFNDLAVTLGQQLLPVGIQLLSWINQVVGWFSRLSPQVQGTILIFAGVIAVLGPLILIIGSLISTVGTLITIFTVVGPVISAISIPVLIVIGVLASLGVAIFLIVRNWDFLKTKTVEVWNFILVNIRQVISLLIALFTGSGPMVAMAFLNIFTGIRDKAVGIFRGVFSGIISTINGGISKVNGVISQIPEIPGFGKVPTIPTIPAFANGGVVGGNSRTGDKILARVNSGEVILNERQQANALSQMEGGKGLNININIDKMMSLGSEKDKRSFVADLADALEIELKKRKLITT